MIRRLTLSRLAPVFAAVLGLAIAGPPPAAAQSASWLLDRPPEAQALHDRDRPACARRYRHAPRPWWCDRRPAERYLHRHRGESRYDRELRGLVLPGVDTRRMMENQYHGNRQ